MIQLMTIWLIMCVSAVAVAPVARAEDSVTYEVVSDQITTANVEYRDSSGRIGLEQVPLPWRMDVTVVDARSSIKDGAEVRADWRPLRGPYKWFAAPETEPTSHPNPPTVTVRIYFRGAVICQSTLDVGNATCYGSTPHFS
jgi:hypothetical protein